MKIVNKCVVNEKKKRSRKVTSKNIRILLYNVIIVLQGNIPSCISSLLFVADHHTESLVLKSPVYDSKVSFKVKYI